MLMTTNLVSAGTGIPPSERAEEAEIYFITPADGDEAVSSVVVRFGFSETGVAPEGVEKPWHGTSPSDRRRRSAAE